MTMIKGFTRFACATVLATGVLAACSGTSPSGRLAPQATFVDARPSNGRGGPRNTLIVRAPALPAHHDPAPSRMQPLLTGQNLLYVSDPATDDVDVFSFPAGLPVGVLTGFNQPQGECADHSGNVYITNTQAQNILEFAHGGTTPIATLDDTGQFPVACAVNPRTGDLAVSNAFDASFYNGGISIFKRAQGTPTVYSAPNFWETFFLSYDNDGNIFVDGLANNGYFTFLFAELHKGSTTFSPIAIDTTINYPGGVIWTLKGIAIGDQEYATTQSAIYLVTLSGSAGTVVGTTVLNETCDIVQFFIQKTRVIGPDACKANANVYKYPAGGNHIKVIKAGLKQPVGSAISVGPPS